MKSFGKLSIIYKMKSGQISTRFNGIAIIFVKSRFFYIQTDCQIG